MQNRLEGIRFEENCGESGRSCLFKNITRRDRLGILDGFRWYPKEHEGFPGRTCGAQESTGVEKVYSLVGFRWPGHSRARALHLRLCARRRQGVAHPFLSAPSHGNAVEAFARTLFDLTSLSLPLSLVFSFTSRPFSSPSPPSLPSLSLSLGSSYSPSFSVSLLDFAQPKNTWNAASFESSPSTPTEYTLLGGALFIAQRDNVCLNELAFKICIWYFFEQWEQCLLG